MITALFHCHQSVIAVICIRKAFLVAMLIAFSYHFSILLNNGYDLEQGVQSILSVAGENHHHFIPFDFVSNAYRLEGSSTL